MIFILAKFIEHKYYKYWNNQNQTLFKPKFILQK